MQKNVEVVFSPKLFQDAVICKDYIVVLTDILRATTSICAAFQNGVREIIPVANLDEAKAYKTKGYLVASEQDGKKLDWADFGNSAFNFTPETIAGKSLVYCTTNGTRAIDIAKHASKIAIGAFVNITALAGWLIKEDMNVLVLCSGWKNKFCLEDALFAGALCERLLAHPGFTTYCDSVHASLDLWHAASPDLFGYLEKAAHRHRLKKLDLDDVIPYSLTPDSTHVIPVFEGGVIREKH